MALQSTQPLKEMSTRSLPGGKGRPERMADLTAILLPIKCGSLDISQPYGVSMACYKDGFYKRNNYLKQFLTPHNKCTTNSGLDVTILLHNYETAFSEVLTRLIFNKLTWHKFIITAKFLCKICKLMCSIIKN
jgi:hypothetical protein